MDGRRLGKYQLFEALGRGGQASVFRAQDAASGRVVAVKLMGRTVATSASRRFLREADILARLDHPNIVRLLDVAEADDYLISVLEFIDGDSLAGLLEQARNGHRSPLGARELVSLGVDLLSALNYAHGLDLLHRDVKPANLLVDRAGRGHLGDFGLATFRDLTRLTQTGQTVGTLRYMSPEQLRGETLDRRSDLYQAGLVLYEMAWNELPFPGDNPYSQAMARTTGDVLVPERLPAGLGPSFADVVRRALARDVAGRFQDAASFAEALAGVAVTSGVDAPKLDLKPPSAEVKAAVSGVLSRSAVTRGVVPRRRRLVGTLVAVASAAAVVSAAAYVALRPADPVARALGEARQELGRGRPVAAAHTLGSVLGRGPLTPEAAGLLDEVAPALASSPDGRRAALLLVGQLRPGSGLRAPAGRGLAASVAVEAQSLAGAGQTTAARDLLRRAEASGACSLESRLLAARLAYAAGAATEARAAVEACLAEDPGNVPARLLQADLYFDQGALGWGEDALRAAVRSAPADLDAVLSLAGALGSLGSSRKMSEAQALLADDRIWRDVGPIDRARLLAGQARLDARVGLGERALARAREADGLAPSTKTKMALFEAYRALGLGERAQGPLEEVVAMEPNDVELRAEAYRRALLLSLPSAASHLGRLGELAPSFASAMRSVQSVSQQLAAVGGNPSPDSIRRLEPFFEKLQRELPRDPLALYLLAAVRCDLGRLDEAEELARRAQQALPDSHAVWFLLGRIADRRGDAAGAEAAWRRSLQSRPLQPVVIVELYQLFKRGKRFADQVTFLDECLAQRPHDVDFVVNRAQALVALGRTDGATSALTDLLELDPAKLPIRYDPLTGESSSAGPEQEGALARAAAGPRLVDVYLWTGRPASALERAERLATAAERSLAAGSDPAMGPVDAAMARGLGGVLDARLPGLSAPGTTSVTGLPDDLLPRARTLRARVGDLSERLTKRFGRAPITRRVPGQD